MRCCPPALTLTLSQRERGRKTYPRKPRKGEGKKCEKVDSLGAGIIPYLTVTVTGSEKRVRPEGPEEPPGAGSSLPLLYSSGSSVPCRNAAVIV
jgi:hypothetical protein